MNLYKTAKEFEKESQQYYLDLADKTDNTGFKAILEMLAKAENNHLKIVESLEKSDPLSIEVNSDILADAKTIFSTIRHKSIKLSDEISQVDLYKKALNFEKESHAYYMEKSDALDSSHAKEVLLILAEEENKHVFLIENIIEFLRKPETWIEDAEFNHLDEY